MLSVSHYQLKFPCDIVRPPNMINSSNYSIIQFQRRHIYQQNSVSSLYGMVKMHKENQPLRAISAEFGSLTYRAENFLKNMISLLLKDCHYLIDSPKRFKEQLLPIMTKFDATKHVVVSFNTEKLYHKVDVKRTVNFVMKEIFTKTR